MERVTRMTRRAQLVAHTSTACASVITSATRAFYFYTSTALQKNFGSYSVTRSQV